MTEVSNFYSHSSTSTSGHLRSYIQGCTKVSPHLTVKSGIMAGCIPGLGGELVNVWGWMTKFFDFNYKSYYFYSAMSA